MHSEPYTFFQTLSGWFLYKRQQLTVAIMYRFIQTFLGREWWTERHVAIRSPHSRVLPNCAHPSCLSEERVAIGPIHFVHHSHRACVGKRDRGKTIDWMLRSRIVFGGSIVGSWIVSVIQTNPQTTCLWTSYFESGSHRSTKTEITGKDSQFNATIRDKDII